MTIKIEGTSERVNNFAVWKVWKDGVMLCSFFGPMAAASAATVAKAMKEENMLTPVDALNFSK